MKLYKTALLSIILILPPIYTHAARIKDIASIKGVRKNQLFGYGLIVGLAGTGDSATNVPFAAKSIASMLSRMGITISQSEIDKLKVKNIAAVIVTADLPPFARTGSKIDVLISSIGDAQSLKGGTLLMTPLKAADGQVYSVAQGPVSIGGGSNKKGGRRNHLTAGRIAGGAIIEREIHSDFKNKKYLTLSLHKPDFTTAFRAAKAINSKLKDTIAKPYDAGNIKVKIPSRFKNKEISFISDIEEISIVPDMPARVVIDERTGTVVVGKNVLVSTVAISHGSLSVEIKARTSEVTAPAAAIRRRRARRTRGAASKGKRLLLIHEGVNIEEIVDALNAIGVTPQDLISIFQSLKASGALQAELEII